MNDLHERTPPAGAHSAFDLLASPPVLPGIDADSAVLITGGSGAIGARCAAVLSAMGARVAIMSRDRPTVDAAAARSRSIGAVLGLAGDISDEADVRAAVDTVVGEFGRLDATVNLAAVGDSGSQLDDLTVDEIDTVLRINLRGALLVARESAKPMKAAGHGSIVNVASIAGHRVTSGRLAYGPSKAAVVYLSRQLAVELGSSGVRSNSISPGQTPTALRKFSDPAGGDNVASSPDPNRPTKTGKIPIGRRGTLDDYVGTILFLISDLSAYVTGADILVDGGAGLPR
jgi:NAD(P)-dependent dehydrogenase (short-subunit alcohol dehydrogenase family)